MNTPKKALLVTFDFSQRGKSGTGLAAASLLAACKAHNRYSSDFTIEHLPIEMPKEGHSALMPQDVLDSIKEYHDITNLDRLVLACYVWSTHLIEPLIQLCRQEGFQGKTILGGYQIVESTCQALYPSGDYYISSYAEKALPAAILDESPDTISSTGKIMDQSMDKTEDFQDLASPFLDGTYAISQGEEMIHWETHRGCIFKCNFCLHRDIKTNSVFDLNQSRIMKELALFKQKGIKKINVLDPVFNRGPHHKDILKEAIRLGIESELCLQVRFELIDEKFLELCSQLNIHLEFGLQTAVKEEWVTIERPNCLQKIEKSISLLKRYQQSFEISLIYGLPNQTVASFKQSIRFLTKHGIHAIKAFPLMLLEGTDLKDKKDEFGLIEGLIDDSGIPHVIASSTFSHSDWKIMHRIAQQLNNTFQHKDAA